MSKIARFAVLVASLASLFAVLSSSAGAVTWHNTGSTSFSATGGPGTLFVTGSGGTNSISCPSSHGTGTGLAEFTGSTYSVSGTVTFGSGVENSGACKIAGITSYVDCTYTLTGITFASPVTSGNADVTCRAGFITSGPICHIAGSTPGHYTNPSGATPGKLTLTNSATLTVTGETSASSCNILLGGFTSGVGHLTEQTLNVAGGSPTTLGPVLNRTA